MAVIEPARPFVVLVRHAKAASRGRWDGPDEGRPLTSKGWLQAEELGRRFSDWTPTALLSSPSRRCVETLHPLAQLWGAEVAQTSWLAEGADDSGLDELLRRAETGLVACSHGDVLPALVETWANRVGVTLPSMPWRKAAAALLTTGDKPTFELVEPTI